MELTEFVENVSGMKLTVYQKRMLELLDNLPKNSCIVMGRGLIMQRRVMKEILLIARNDGQCSEWFRYLTKKIPQTMIRCDRRLLAIDILTDNHHIIIRPKSENCYRGRRPDYHCVYGLEANSYLLSTGSKSLRSLDDVIDIVKGGNYDYIRKNKI